MLKNIFSIGCFLLINFLLSIPTLAAEKDLFLISPGSISKWTITQETNVLKIKTSVPHIVQEVSLKKSPCRLKIYIKEGDESFNSFLLEGSEVGRGFFNTVVKPSYLIYYPTNKEKFKNIIHMLYEKDKTLPLKIKELFLEYGVKFLTESSPILLLPAPRSYFDPYKYMRDVGFTTKM